MNTFSGWTAHVFISLSQIHTGWGLYSTTEEIQQASAFLAKAAALFGSWLVEMQCNERERARESNKPLIQ